MKFLGGVCLSKKDQSTRFCGGRFFTLFSEKWFQFFRMRFLNFRASAEVCAVVNAVLVTVITRDWVSM